MSLVDYPFDDEDDEEDEGQEEEKQKVLNQVAQKDPQSSDLGVSGSSSSSSFLAGIHSSQSERDFPITSKNAAEMYSRLPDASELLSSFNSGATSYPFRAPATVSATASRKRPDLNRSVDVPHKKIPRGNLPPSRIPIDTADGLLIPPQLRGRSNIATEDLDRLFTKRLN